MKITGTLRVDGHLFEATGATRDQARVQLQRAWSTHVREHGGPARNWRWVDVADSARITRS